jgi:hypothetical protein
MKRSRFYFGRSNAFVLCMIQVGVSAMSADFVAMHEPKGWVGVLFWGGLATVLLGFNFANRATEMGYSNAWGVFAILSFVGLCVVYSLPNRAGNSRGFDVVSRSSPD